MAKSKKAKKQSFFLLDSGAKSANIKNDTCQYHD
jgi:hypothetical protein